MLGLNRNTHEMNFDVNGLILPITIQVEHMICLFIAEKNVKIGKKRTDFTSNGTNQNKYIFTPNLHSFYACGLAVARCVPDGEILQSFAVHRQDHELFYPIHETADLSMNALVLGR